MARVAEQQDEKTRPGGASLDAVIGTTRPVPARCAHCGWDDDGTLTVHDEWAALRPPVPRWAMPDRGLQVDGGSADEEGYPAECPRCEPDEPWLPGGLCIGRLEGSADAR